MLLIAIGSGFYIFILFQPPHHTNSQRTSWLKFISSDQSRSFFLTSNASYYSTDKGSSRAESRLVAFSYPQLIYV